MSLLGLIPSQVSLNAAIAICVVAFISGTARGFSGFFLAYSCNNSLVSSLITLGKTILTSTY